MDKPTTDPSFRHRVIAGLLQAFRAIGACAIVTASLLVFPSALPWLIAPWLAAYTVLVFCGRRGLICLGLCAVILVAKRPTPAPGLLVLLGVMLAVILIGAVMFRRGKLHTPRRFACVAAFVLWIAWGVMAADWIGAAHCRHPVTLKGNRPVACLGDSMTSLGMFGGYPQDLRNLISMPVVDIGMSGMSAAQVAQHFLPDLIRHNPQVVVIELGAHDFLRDHSRAATKANLLTIANASRKIGAEVILMEVPRAYISDPYWGLEREIAREEDIELIPDTALRAILLHSPLLPPGSWLGEPYLTDDSGIHPNAAGNRLLADTIAASLNRLYGRSLSQRSPEQK